MTMTNTLPAEGQIRIQTFGWARTAYRRKAHVLMWGRKFACGTPTGYGNLIHAEVVTDWGDDPRPIPVFACERCIRIAFPEE